MFSGKFWRGMLTGALVGMTLGAMISRRMDQGSSTMETVTRTAKRTMAATKPQVNRVMRMGKSAVSKTVGALKG
ncbi:MAG: hypothetical protein PHV61_02350 [Limnochordia bacterium]|nr:hypothetical protein [Limnochordia bacterium]MDD2629002.1 hypothetical protein [Limnochordia bacterium]MDD4517750.1 hypothetical protein [Limnochordia bacterium]